MPYIPSIGNGEQFFRAGPYIEMNFYPIKRVGRDYGYSRQNDNNHLNSKNDLNYTDGHNAV